MSQAPGYSNATEDSMHPKLSSDDGPPEVGRVQYAVLYHWPRQDEFVVERRETVARFETRTKASAFIASAIAKETAGEVTEEMHG